VGLTRDVQACSLTDDAESSGMMAASSGIGAQVVRAH
jgi:hypothetical protein